MRLSYSALSGLPSARFRREGMYPGYPNFRLRTVSSACWPCLLLQPIATTMALTPASRHLGLQVSPLISLRIPNVPPPTTRVARMSFSNHHSTHTMCFRLRLLQASSPPTPRRIEFAILRTASSSPVALHPASQRRSYFRLQGLGLPWHGLPPC